MLTERRWTIGDVVAGVTKRPLTVYAPDEGWKAANTTADMKSNDSEYMMIKSDDKIRFIWCKLQNQIEVYKPGFYVVLPKKRTS